MTPDCIDDGCGAPVAIAEAITRLLDAVDELHQAQGTHDLTWTPLDLARHYCEVFTQSRPTMTVTTLVGGLDVSSAALRARAAWERPQRGGDE